MKKVLSLILALALLIDLVPMQAFAASADHTLTLDSTAWENLTYRDIFVENNLAYLNGFDHSGWGAYKQYAGTNTITAEACFSEPYSLKAAGSPSQQIVSSVTNPAGDYFVASKVSCTRYVKGELGVCLQDTTVGVTAVTNGFVTSAGIVTMPGSHRIFIGSIHSADLDGYVDDTVVVNMNIFSTRPSCDEMTRLYEQYVQIEMNRDRNEAIYTDYQMLDAFMKYLKNKASAIGMDSSTFEDPVGNSCNWATARDIAKLLIYANGYEQLHGIWSNASMEITVSGDNARTKTVVSTVIKEELEQYYHILGGKTGTLGNTRNLSVILEIPNSDDKLVVVALCADGQNGTEESRYQAVRQIADAAMAKYRDPSVDNSAVDVCCASAIACLLPTDGANLKNLTVLYEKDADTRRNPASITKVLTAVCALDILESLDTAVTYKQFDITTCPWNSGDFYPGDTMTLEHTLFALLLPSNDVTAFTIARSAGEVLLKPVHSHKYSSVVTAPTCTEQGYTTYTCACGDSYVGDCADATGHSYENGACKNCGKEDTTVELFKRFSATDFFLKQGVLSDGKEYVVAIYSNTNNARMVVIPIQDGATYYIRVKNNGEVATNRMKICTFAESFDSMTISPLASERNMSALDPMAVSVAQDIIFWDPNTDANCVSEYEGVFVNTGNAKTLVLFTAWGADPSLVEVSVKGENHIPESDPLENMDEMISILIQNMDHENQATKDIMKIAQGFWEHRDEFIYCSGTALDQPWNYWSYTGYVDSSNTGKTVTAENAGYKRIDCSTFVRYVVNGIDYYSTPYYNALELTQVEQGGLENGAEAANSDLTICRTGEMAVRPGKKLILEAKNSNYSFTKIFGYDASGNVVQVLENTATGTVFVPDDGVVYICAEMRVTAESDYAPAKPGVPAAILKCLRIREDERLGINAECPLSGYRNANEMCKWFDTNGYAVEIDKDSFNPDDLRVGTVIFWGRNSGTWAYKNITHTSIYIGDGYVMHVSAPYGLLGGEGILIEPITALMNRYDIPLAAASSPEYHQVEDHIHAYTPSVTAPTCAEQGYTTYTCACGDSYKDSIVAARGYEWMLEDGEFKLLLIGNSFSEDASNFYSGKNSQLLDILQAMLGADVKVTVGLCYSGGKGLNWHATQSELGNSSYTLRIISTDNGKWKSYGSYTSANALVWTDWDVVTLQHYEINTTTGEESNAYPNQVDPKFHKLEAATEFMLDYVDRYAPNAVVYFYMHWARAYNPRLNESLATYKKMAEFFPVVLDYAGTESANRFETIIPVGLSIQNARTTYLAKLAYNTTAYADGTLNLTTDAQIGLQRDGGHLSYNVGRYIAALTFAEMIIPEQLRADGYVLPEIRVTESVGKLPQEYTEIAQKAVLAAVNSWKNGKLGEVSTIEGYTEDPTVAAGQMMSGALLQIYCGADVERLKAAVLALLPADFVVDSVVITAGAAAKLGDSFSCEVTIRYGYTSLKVTVNGKVVDHAYVVAVTAPTCTKQGYTTHTCPCGDSYVDSYTEKTAHSYGAWQQVKAPACDAEGQDKRVCSACGDTQLRDTRITGDPNKIMVSTLRSESDFAGKTLLLIGDSITCGVGVTDPKTQVYGALVGTQFGMKVINKAISGSGYCTGGKMTTNNTLTEANVASADIITIMLGINDFNWAVKDGYWNGKPNYYDATLSYCQLGEFGSDDTSTVYGALKSWCEKIVAMRQKAEFADKQFVFITPLITSWNASMGGARNWDQSKVNVHGHTLRQYCTAIMEVCAYYEIPVLDANMFSGIYYKSAEDNNVAETGGDGVHINAAGHALLADALAEFLMEGYTYENRPVADCGHRYEETVIAPSCSEMGYTVHRCPECGYGYVDSFVVAKGHTDADKNFVCDACGEDLCTDHKPVTIKGHAATCTATGLTDGTKCGTCGEILTKQEVIPAKGHSFTDYIPDGNATVDADGTKTARCDHGCGAVDTVADPGSKLPPEKITSDTFEIADGWLRGVAPDTAVEALLGGILEENVRVLEGGVVVAPGTTVGTGMVIQLLVGETVVDEVRVVVAGDVNGDGAVSITDMLLVKTHLLKKTQLTGAAAEAADKNRDEGISITDFLQIKAILLGKE